MKIIAIRLKNLTSIEGSVEIDFTMEPLSSAGIFAISGATGAGKSTLLDALCLALYDKAPRFAASVESINLADVGDNQINQSDVRNLLRRGTSDGYAEVDFQGVDGHRYRSRWSVRRTRNKASGSLQPQVLEVKDLDTEKELSIEWEQDILWFDWFDHRIDIDDLEIYTPFIKALYKMAENAVRVTAKEKPVENEKFAMRTFLNRIGLSGKEYKPLRKALIKNLSGNRAFRYGRPENN